MKIILIFYLFQFIVFSLLPFLITLLLNTIVIKKNSKVYNYIYKYYYKKIYKKEYERYYCLFNSIKGLKKIIIDLNIHDISKKIDLKILKKENKDFNNYLLLKSDDFNHFFNIVNKEFVNNENNKKSHYSLISIIPFIKLEIKKNAIINSFNDIKVSFLIK